MKKVRQDIFKFDLKYPEKLYLLHNYYSLSPEKIAISYAMVSNYCKKIAVKYGIKVVDVKKIISDLGNKTNYVVHYRNLQVCLSLGMRLTKIHVVLRFKQSDWMKKYIVFSTEKRENAANSSEKVFSLN